MEPSVISEDHDIDDLSVNDMINIVKTFDRKTLNEIVIKEYDKRKSSIKDFLNQQKLTDDQVTDYVKRILKLFAIDPTAWTILSSSVVMDNPVRCSIVLVRNKLRTRDQLIKLFPSLFDLDDENLEYKKILASFDSRLFLTEVHLVSSVPDMRQFVTEEAKKSLEPWDPWKTLAEEIETLKMAKERKDLHHTLISDFLTRFLARI